MDPPCFNREDRRGGGGWAKTISFCDLTSRQLHYGDCKSNKLYVNYSTL